MTEMGETKVAVVAVIPADDHPYSPPLPVASTGNTQDGLHGVVTIKSSSLDGGVLLTTQKKKNLDADLVDDGADDTELVDDRSTIPSPVVQEALGVTRHGTCLRHPNCPVLSLVQNRVQSCRVCFSEEKSVGIRQGKSFAAVVHQLQRMAETHQSLNQSTSQLDNTTPSGGGGDACDGRSSSITEETLLQSEEPALVSVSGNNGTVNRVNTTSAGTVSPLHQPQTLESIMKRLAQVQNWMLRQKEKEVLSLQLHIHRLEQRLKDADRTNSEQKDTIKALRRTIQQDLKIIKTMATQKEREIEDQAAAVAAQQQQQAARPLSEQELDSTSPVHQPPPCAVLSDTEPLLDTKLKGDYDGDHEDGNEEDDDDDDDDDDDEDAAIMLYNSPIRKHGNHNLPPKPLPSAPPNSIATLMVDQDVLVSPLPASTDSSPLPVSESPASATAAPGLLAPFPPTQQLRSLERQMPKLKKKKPPASSLMAPGMLMYHKQHHSSRSLDGCSVVSETIPENAEVVATPRNQFGASTADARDIYVVPPQQSQLKGPRSSEYYNDSDISFATDPSRIFASFRGGLLDIPKSPPPACHDHAAAKKRNKLKLKFIKMDTNDKQALELPKIRNVTRTYSGLSDCSNDTDIVPGTKKEPSLTLLASQLQALPLLQDLTPGGTTGTDTVNDDNDDDDGILAPLPKSPESQLTTDMTSPLSRVPIESEDDTGSGGVNGVKTKASLSTTGPPPLSPLSATGAAAATKERLDQNKELHETTEKKIPSGGTTINTSPTKKLVPMKQGDGPSSGAHGGLNKIPFVMNSGQQRPNDKFLFEVTRASCQDKYGDPGIYTGTILVTEGLPHGKGIMNYESGRVYDGEWIAGHWNGKGKLLNSNGDTYQGEFVFDARHGHGVYKWDNGDVYVGSFSQDKRHGKGKFSFHNGNIYQGDFVDGMFEGFGRYDFDGGYYEGEWKQGRYDGNGELQYASGGKYTGEFRNSVAHGFGMEVTAEGRKRRGVWEDGQPVDYAT